MVYFKYMAMIRKIALTGLLTSVLIVYTGFNAYSQRTRNEAPPLRERIFFGGDFGLQFGTITNIEIAPVVGLWVLPRLAVAAGPEYTYYARKNIGSTNIYGGRVYTQFVLIQDLNNIIPAGIHLGLFLHVEDEFQSLESVTPFWNTGATSERFTVNTFLAGGGISQPMGRRAMLNLTFLWALDDAYDLYGNPEIRISFIF
ncbi:MAG TPA: hypothetical protein DDW27_02470 [Bacteroidales bacterium]|nr:hypothetical protein [Bacteroidales bacterium]